MDINKPDQNQGKPRFSENPAPTASTASSSPQDGSGFSPSSTRMTQKKSEVSSSAPSEAAAPNTAVIETSEMQPAPIANAGAGDASEQLQQVRAALLHRERQMSAIRRISAKLFSQCSLDELLVETLGTARDVVGADVGSLQLYDPQTDCLVFRHVLDPDSRSLIGRGTPIQTGINGKVFRNSAADITLKATERPEWNPAVDEQTGYHTQSMLTVPVQGTDGKPIGVIQLLNADHRYDERDVEVLEVLCAQVAQAIANAHLLEEAERRLEHLQALRSIDSTIASTQDLGMTLAFFVEKVADQLRIDALSVSLLSPHMLTLEFAAGHGFRSQSVTQKPLQLGQGNAGRAALERRIVYVPDLSQCNDLLQPSQWVFEEFVSYFAAPLIARGQVKGVLEAFTRKPFQPTTEWYSLLETMASQAAIAIDNAGLLNDLQRSNMELAVAYDTTLEGWSRALDLRDRETEGHTRRVTDMTLQLARRVNIPDSQLVHIRRGALLHDIGKMGIPDSILLKPGPLSEEEWTTMRRHPLYALDLLAHIPYLLPALDVPYCHHERFDGSGYPRGLRGAEIPLAARLFAVVDVWDALCSDRPYRAGWPEDQVRQYIIENSGSHFDPAVVEAFLAMKD
jgi:HD-GYP domain-containing protein (c-di-GMP phosphodiesterase class II)